MNGATSLLAQAAFIEKVNNAIIFPIMQFLLVVAFVYFLYGVLQLVIAGDPKKIEDAKGQIKWGIFGLFVIVAFAGLMGLISDTLKAIFE